MESSLILDRADVVAAREKARPVARAGCPSRMYVAACDSLRQAVSENNRNHRHSCQEPLWSWRTSRPITRGGPPGVRGDGELSSVPGPSLWSLPWARDPGESARPRDIGRCQMLPFADANATASQRYKISGLNPHGLLPCCLRFAPPSRPESGKTHY